jgi:3-phenylpropionate/trans-cinnamate dioxygenase ferredoxin reductase subunit
MKEGNRMTRQMKSLFFILVYLILIFLPLLVFLIFETPESRAFWRDFSVLLGFVGLSMAGLQFIPTTRLAFLTDIFDMDKVYKMHHVLSVLSVLLVLLHPCILLINNPNILLLFNPFTAPWRAQAGWIGLAGLLLIALTSIYRKELHLGYNAWHGIHTLLALVITVFGLIHIFKVNYYSAALPMRIAWILEIAIWLTMIIIIRIVKPLKIKQHPFTVHQVIQEIPGVWTLVLKPRGHAGFHFNAGQVAWIHINTSPFTLHRNPFSVSGSALAKEELRLTIKALGDFSSSIGDLKGGETVYVDGPYGNFPLDDASTKNGLVMLAGGIGIAPIMSILKTLADQKDQRPLTLFYGSYDEENIICQAEIEKLKKVLNLTGVNVLEKPSGKIPCESGYISQAILERYLPADRDDLYFFQCGPLPMIKAMAHHLKNLGVSKQRIRSEQYEMA